MTVTIVLHERPARDGKYHLYVRTIIDRKVSRKSTGIAIEKQFFNPAPKNFKYIRSAHPQADYYNDILYQLIRDQEDRVKAGEAPGVGGRLSFYNHADKYLELIRLKNYNTWRRIKSHMESLKDFTKGDLLFSQLDYERLQAYEAYLRAEGNALQTINAKMKSIRVVLYDAIRAGKMGQHANPFFKYKIPNEKSKKERLLPEEVKRMELLMLPFNSHLDKARDCFVFSYYCRGMRISDVLTVKKSQVKDGTLKYTMRKTGTDVKILLMPQAKAIIDKYPDSPYIIPVLPREYGEEEMEAISIEISKCTALINKHLKKIAELCGITINLSTHIARHSFASLARNSGKDIYKIMEMMGHGDVKITQAYVNSITEDEMSQDTMDVYTTTDKIKTA